MNLQEQLRAFQQKRNELAQRQQEMMTRAAEEDRTLDDAEEKDFDELVKQLEKVDNHIARVRPMVETNDDPKDPVKSRKGPDIIVRRQDKDPDFQGQPFVRRAICRALSQLNGFEVSAGQIAEYRYGKSAPTLVRLIKAGVPAGSAYGSGSDSWGTELVDADARYTGDFLEYLKAMTVFDRLPFMEVPKNVRVKGQDGVGTGYWVGEGKAIKASAQSFSAVDLEPLKVGALTPVTRELLEDSSPAAETLIRNGLGIASAQRIDLTVFSDDAAVAGESPAGLLVGAVAKSSSGLDAGSVRRDLNALTQEFITAKAASGLYVVANPSTTAVIGLQTNALGQPEFGELGADGGTYKYPWVTGDNINASHLIMLRPADIWKIGDSGIEVTLSRDATIEQDTAPAGDSEAPTAAANTLISAFQSDSVFFKIVRRINFAKRRTFAVQYVNDAAYTVDGQS